MIFKIPTWDVLLRDGSNLTSILAQLPHSVKKQVEEYLAVVVPGVHAVEVKGFGPKETLDSDKMLQGTNTHGDFSQIICLMARSAD